VSLFEITEIIIEIFFILFQRKKSKNIIMVQESLKGLQMSEQNHKNLTEEVRSLRSELSEEINKLKKEIIKNKSLLYRLDNK